MLQRVWQVFAAAVVAFIDDIELSHSSSLFLWCVKCIVAFDTHVVVGGFWGSGGELLCTCTCTYQFRLLQFVAFGIVVVVNIIVSKTQIVWRCCGCCVEFCCHMRAVFLA